MLDSDSFRYSPGGDETKRREKRVNGLTTSRVLFLPFVVDGIPIIIQFSRVLWGDKKGEKIRKKSGELNVKE